MSRKALVSLVLLTLPALWLIAGSNSTLAVGPGVTVAVTSGAQPAHSDAKPFKIDSVHSSAIFRIKHLDTAYFWGRFNDISGTVTWDAAKPEATTFDVKIKTASIDTKNGQRDTHLKGPEFFDAKQFPMLSFKSKSVKKGDGNVLEVSGDLTMHGVTKPLTVKIEMTGAGKGMNGQPLVGFETTFEVKRSDFGMNKMIGPVGDDVRIIVSLEAGK